MRKYIFILLSLLAWCTPALAQTVCDFCSGPTPPPPPTPIPDVIRTQPRTPSGAQYNNASVVDYNLKAMKALFAPYGIVPSRNGAKDSTGLIYIATGDSSFNYYIQGLGFLKLKPFNGTTQYPLNFGFGILTPPTFYNGSAITPLVIDSNVFQVKPDGVIRGLTITASEPHATVQPGSYRISGKTFTVDTATVLTIDAQDPTNSIYDLIYGNNVGMIGIVSGTPSTSPVLPDLPDSSIMIGYVFIQPASISVVQPVISNYVTTNTDQSGIGGNKGWIGSQTYTGFPTSQFYVDQQATFNRYTQYNNDVKYIGSGGNGVSFSDGVTVHFYNTGNTSDYQMKNIGSGVQLIEYPYASGGLTFVHNDIIDQNGIYFAKVSGASSSYTKSQTDSIARGKADTGAYVKRTVGVIHLSTMSQLATYSGQAKSVTVLDTLKGGLFLKLPKGSNAANTVTTYASNATDSLWYRQYNQAQGINIEWAGAIRSNTSADNSGAINLTCKVAVSLGQNVYFPGWPYYSKNQILHRGTPWIGVAGQSSIVFAHDAAMADTSGHHFAMIYNSNFNTVYNAATAQRVDISGIIIDFRVNQNYTYVGENLDGLQLANVNGGVIENVTYRDSTSLPLLTVGNTGIDVYAGVKNMTFRNVTVIRNNPTTSGGGMWVRNKPFYTGTYNESYNTFNISIERSSFSTAGADEALSVYGSIGKTKKVRVQSSNFINIPSAITHAKMVSIFAFNQSTRPASGISDVIFDNNTIRDSTSNAALMTVGALAVDASNVVDSNIVVSNNRFISNRKGTGGTTSLITNAQPYGTNIKSINNTYESNGNAVNYGVKDFDLSDGDKITGNISTAAFSGVTEVRGATAIVTGTSTVGIIDATYINNAVNITAFNACVQRTLSGTCYVKGGNFTNTRTDGSFSYGFNAVVASSSTPDFNIDGAEFTGSQGNAYFLFKSGIGTNTTVQNCVLTGTGTPYRLNTGATGFKFVNGNNLFGTLENIRATAFISGIHNAAVPLGTTVRLTGGGSAFRNSGTAGDATDWTALPDVPAGTAGQIPYYSATNVLSRISLTGLQKDNGTSAPSAAVANTDYLPAANPTATGTVTIPIPSFSTTAAIAINQAYLPTAAPSILSTTTGINAKSTGTTALYTVPTGKTLVVTAVIIRCSAASVITAGPAIDIGDNTIGAASVYANTVLTGLTTTVKDFGFSTVGMSSVIAAGSIVNLNLNTASTGTSQTISATLIGYLQ